MTPAEISVIIINYGTADLTIAAVESVLERGHGGRAVDVHLVDNASPGDDAARLARAHAGGGWGDRVTFYAETVNHGFGRGNNLVLEKLASRAVPPRYVFLLNPDARLKNEAIDQLAGFLDTHPEAGLAGARIEKPDGTGVTAAFRFPSVLSEFSQALSFGPVSRLLRHKTVPLGADLPQSPVDWVAGAAVMGRLEALQQAGFFDPEYFLYYEEVDLMRQTARMGWETWYVPGAEIVHAEGAATNVKSGRAERRRRPAYWYHSWQYYFRKNHGRTGAALAGLGWMLGAGLNHVIARLRGRAPSAALRLFRDFWAMAGRPLAGMKARPYD